MLSSHTKCCVEQIVTCVPTKSLSKRFTVGAVTPEEIQQFDRKTELTDEIGDDFGTKGRVLWLRGLTRLQSQVGNITACIEPIAVCFCLADYIQYHCIDG